MKGHGLQLLSGMYYQVCKNLHIHIKATWGIFPCVLTQWRYTDRDIGWTDNIARHIVHEIDSKSVFAHLQPEDRRWIPGWIRQFWVDADLMHTGFFALFNQERMLFNVHIKHMKKQHSKIFAMQFWSWWKATHVGALGQIWHRFPSSMETGHGDNHRRTQVRTDYSWCWQNGQKFPHIVGQNGAIASRLLDANYSPSKNHCSSVYRSFCRSDGNTYHVHLFSGS